MLRAAIKYLKSYFKSEWTLRDYPLRFRHQAAEPQDYDLGPGYTLIPWTVQIVNWWQMGGGGDTRLEAYADLETKFQEFSAANDRLPRPGTGAPLEFPSVAEVERFDAIATDFLHKVLGADEDDEIWISDESSLYDFEALYQPVEVSLDRMREAYGIDVSDVEGYKLVDLFARIAEQDS